MLEAAENLEFEKAAKLRDEMNKLEKKLSYNQRRYYEYRFN